MYHHFICSYLYFDSFEHLPFYPGSPEDKAAHVQKELCEVCTELLVNPAHQAKTVLHTRTKRSCTPGQNLMFYLA